MKLSVLVLVVLLLSGCTQIVANTIDPLVSRDLDSFVMLAEKYGTDEEARCAAYLQSSWSDKADLLHEDADGLIANVYKALLLKRKINQNEQLFAKECGQFAGQIMIEIGRVLRNVR